MKYLFAPININNVHWTLLVVFMKEKIIRLLVQFKLYMFFNFITYYDGRYYDSCGGPGDNYLEGNIFL